MTLTSIAEAVLLGMLVSTVVMVNPESATEIYAAALFVYLAVLVLQWQSFSYGVRSGFVKPGSVAPDGRQGFFLAPGCPNRWLVKRHIRMFL